MQRFFPDVRSYRFHGPGRTTRPLLYNEPVIAVSTFDTVRSSVEQLATIPFFYVILDEATAIKNPTSARAKAVKALNAAHWLSLSGTPVENRPAELWSIYDFLMTGHLGPCGTFERVFENPILGGNQEAVERLGRRIRPFMLRRLKEEVARDLPEKIEMDEWCELTVEQRALYNEIQAQAQPTINALSTGGRVDYDGSILPILTKLKQVCDHPAIVNQQTDPLADRSHKFDWIVARMADMVAGGEQVLIFSHFLGMLDLLEAATRQRGLTFIRIDGATGARQALVDGFNRGEAKVGLFSIRAAGHGITVDAGGVAGDFAAVGVGAAALLLARSLIRMLNYAKHLPLPRIPQPRVALDQPAGGRDAPLHGDHPGHIFHPPTDGVVDLPFGRVAAVAQLGRRHAVAGQPVGVGLDGQADPVGDVRWIGRREVGL